MELTVKKVSSKSKNIKIVKNILKTSFTKEERMPFFMMRLLSKTPNTDFLAFYDQASLCAFVYMATYDDITLIIYLAVDELERSKGYGTKVLKLIEGMYPKNKMVLFIDRCDVDAADKNDRLKRKQFYSRNGYQETDYFIDSTKEYQEIMIKNGPFEKEQFIGFLKKYSNGAMKSNIVEKNKENTI